MKIHWRRVCWVAHLRSFSSIFFNIFPSIDREFMQVGSWTFLFFFDCRAGPDRLEECRLEECKWRKIGRSEECSIPQFFRLQLRNEECSVDTSQMSRKFHVRRVLIANEVLHAWEDQYRELTMWEVFLCCILSFRSSTNRRTADWERILNFSILNGWYKPQAHALPSCAYE